MNYSDFYTNTKRRITEALLSMWASGQKDTQKYLEQVFQEEPIVAEPVFQSMFPWQSSDKTFEQYTNVFDEVFINALDGIRGTSEKYRFPKDRKPYIHQSESWEQLLNKGKSIVVTSGTGSGKTECFMMPIIQDLMRQQNNIYGKDKKGGVQAIFLYPLNALMSSQTKRMSAWCKAVSPNVTFAMYKGDTREDHRADDKKEYPELVSREKIREIPPQILFTNPTMLEYMLVRKKDKPILNISKEKKSLRWIVLDEAHTYSGSSAAELALQIRRILDAFGVTVNDVRFAATSATLGSGKDDEYKEFIAKVTGKKQEDIVVIHGSQYIPSIDDSKLKNIINKLNNEFESKFTFTLDSLSKLRDDIQKNTLSATQIGKRFAKNNPSIEDCLKLVDRLSEKDDRLLSPTDRRGALLPTRAHFFVRNMGGLYACVNPECLKHEDIRIELGALTTIKRLECSECGSKLIEVNRCNACGNMLLVGEEKNNTYGFQTNEQQSIMEIESEEDEDHENKDDSFNEALSFVLATRVKEPPVAKSSLEFVGIDAKKGQLQVANEGKYARCYKENGTIACPHCGEQTDKLHSLHTGSLFSRLLAPTLLEQAQVEVTEKSEKTNNVLWDGRKYISFTDNRQGTAKSTFKLNIEVERNWIRTAIYHYLSDQRRNTLTQSRALSEKEQQELDMLKQYQLNPNRVAELERIKDGNTNPSNSYKTFTAFSNTIIGNNALGILFEHLPYSFRNGRDKTDYLQQLMIDQFGRRPKRVSVNNPETMGFVRVVYPAIETATMPNSIQDIFKKLNWVEQDWRDFLKISLYFLIRENRHIIVPPNSKRFRTQAFINSEIYPSESTNLKKWPTLNLKNDDTVKNPNRLVVLLLLAMGIKKEKEVTVKEENYINQILDAAWNFLKQNTLESNNERESGYRLNLLGDKVAYQIIEKAWICPVNQVPLDTIFRGYSPLVNSRIASNLENYKITEQPILYPYFPYAYNRDNNHDFVDDAAILNWKQTAFKDAIDAGLWSNQHERILLNNPIYLSAEHTAQQDKEELRRIEEKFDKHELNILSCSTTMEMGVDISGISEVVMNNVPPKPANYLQRAGRAGRGSETKALALTFCAPNPVGSGVFKNQKWAMTHKTAVPFVSFDSAILVQRHINSFLLASYVATDGQNDVTVSSSVKNFFYPDNGGINHYLTYSEYLNKLRLGDDTAKQSSYLNLVEGTCKNAVPFNDSISESLSRLEEVYSQLKNRIDMLEGRKTILLANHYQEDSPATIAIDAQIRHVKNQNILGFFAEHNYIPSAGIPTGIVEFNTYNITDYINKRNKKQKKEEDSKKQKNENGNEYHFGYEKAKPTLNLTQAISEYAPGNQIVLNESCYTSRGIVMKSQWDDAHRVVFQHCPSCGYTRLNEGIETSCPDCNSPLHGIRNVAKNYTPLIEPAGFSVDFADEPTRTITNKNRKNYTQPALLNMPKWDVADEQSSTQLDIRLSSQANNSEILYYNLGNGYGYAVCIECGRAIPDYEYSETDVDKVAQHFNNHKPLLGGKKDDNKEFCNGNIKRNILLGGRFQTVFVEIRFRNENKILINDAETIYSLGVILTRKLAEIIGINTQELGFGVKQYHSYQSVFIFDTAKGGADYSSRFNELKDDVIDKAKEELEHCDCEKACDKCLINRDSQWYLDKLNRKKALEWLNLEVKSRNNVPNEVKALFSKSEVYSLTTDFPSEIQKVLSNPDLLGITFFVNNEIEKWLPEKWKYFECAKELRIRGKQVGLVFENPTTELKNLSASQFSVLGEICMKFKMQTYLPSINGIDSLLLIELSGNRYLHYFSNKETIVNAFDERWASGQSVIYKTSTYNYPYQFDVWNPVFSFSTDNEIFIRFNTERWNTTSRSLIDKLLNKESEKWNQIFNKIQKESVSITYTDRYLNSPLACHLIVDLINGVIKKANLTIKSITFYLSNNPGYKDDDYKNCNKRNEYLTKYSILVLKNTPNIFETRIEHARDLKFENSNFEFVINPDSGVGGGMRIDFTEKSDWESDDSKDVKIYTNGGERYTVVYKQK